MRASATPQQMTMVVGGETLSDGPIKNVTNPSKPTSQPWRPWVLGGVAGYRGEDEAMKRPGSKGEQLAQERFDTSRRARAFYDKQMLSHLNARMRDFIALQEMVFIATADAQGECDCSFRAGPPGFVAVLDAKTVVYPEYRGNGVMASVGNMLENPHIGLNFIDFLDSTVGLHVNGRARIVDGSSLEAWSGRRQVIPRDPSGRVPECWVVVDVQEAYIHCSKHIPLLHRSDKEIHWGTDDLRRKGGDYFGVRVDRRPAPSERTDSPPHRERRGGPHVGADAGAEEDECAQP